MLRLSLPGRQGFDLRVGELVDDDEGSPTSPVGSAERRHDAFEEAALAGVLREP